MPAHPLEPDRAEMAAMATAAADRVASFVEGLPAAPAAPPAGGGTGPRLTDLLRPPPERPGDLAALLAEFAAAAAPAIETAGPGYLAYVGGGGLYSSALAEFVARAFNRYSGFAAFAPGLVALEDSTLRWLVGEFGLPATGAGLLTTGGSMATLTAVVAARVDRLGDDFGAGTVYVTEFTHRSLAKAARVAGLRADQIRLVPTDADLRMDPEAAAAMIASDRAAGRRWFHVDAAYGGFFHLTGRGRTRLAGIGAADSIVLDPHKGLFLPHGTGVLLVRDGATLRHAYAADGHYLQDLAGGDDLPDYADLGPELTRDYRGLRLWLPLHLHGVGAFPAPQDEKLDLAAFAHAELAATPGLEAPWAPDLSTVAFRLRDGTADEQRALLARVNASGRVFISSTLVEGRVTLRLCIITFRTHRDRVAEAVDIVREAAVAVTAGRGTPAGTAASGPRSRRPAPPAAPPPRAQT